MSGPSADPPRRGRGVRLAPTPIFAVAIVAVALAIPQLYEGEFVVFFLVDVMLFGLVALGLQHIIGGAGVLNLGHAAFFGLGAYGTAWAVEEWGWSTPPALAFGIVVALAGAVVMSPLLRLRGVYFAMATFAFGAAAFELFRLMFSITGGDTGIFGIERIRIAGDELESTEQVYYLVLGVLLAAYVVLALLVRSGYGLTLSAVRQSELGARAAGVDVMRIHLIAVAIGVTLAAIGGGLYAQFHGTIAPGVFDPAQSVALLAMVIIGGVTSRFGALLGALFAQYLIVYLRFLEDYQSLAFGVAIAVFMVVLPFGFAGVPAALLRLVRWARRAVAARVERRVVSAPPDAPDPTEPTPVLRATGLSTGYRGVEVVHEIDLSVDQGEILAVIGPNGAGKSTTMRALVGQLPARRGRVEVAGVDLTGRPTHAFVRHGVALVPEGRRVFAELSVEDNLLLGAHTRRDADRREDTERVLEALPALRALRSRPGAAVSGGEQQMVAVGRALMSRPSVLLLDEPSLGLAPLVVDRVYEAIEGIREAGTAIVLVEQNVALALATADRAVVVQRGRIVLEGRAAAVAVDERVRDAYLGDRSSPGRG